MRCSPVWPVAVEPRTVVVDLLHFRYRDSMTGELRLIGIIEEQGLDVNRDRLLPSAKLDTDVIRIV
jgi:hypothetical protein